MIKSITISRNELTHHPAMLSKLAQYNPQVGGDDTDFVVTCENGDVLAVERKSPNDLLSSIADNRLFNQAAKMKEITPYAYVVVTGLIEPTHIGTNDRQWSYASVWGALLSVQEVGCHVVFCDGEDDFIPCIVRLSKRSRDEMKIKPVRQMSVFGGQEATLATMPGIGFGKASKYLAQFGTLMNTIMNLMVPEMTKDIPGWGEKSALTLKKYMDGEK